MSEALKAALGLQADSCDQLGSPFSGALLRRAAGDLDRGGPAARLVAPWRDLSRRDLLSAAIPLRLLGALHERVLSGEAPGLTQAYPREGRAPDPDVAWVEALAVMEAHFDVLAAFMDHEPQTNEVRRSICLAPGFIAAARGHGLPIRALELGASAGLNLSWDRFWYRFGATTWGDPASPVRLDTDWSGPDPDVTAPIRVIERAACDRRPVNLTDDALRRRLIAYVWPDQFERLARIRAAIDVALAHAVQVEAADAVDWADREATPQAGVLTVLYHSVFWQYMPPERQAALTRVIEDKGALATRAAPFAWLRMEPPSDGPWRMEVSLTAWPGGEAQVLAEVHPHGAKVTWRG